MKPMIATRRRGTWRRRSASTRSGNGVVNESRRAAWTLTQLLRAIVANSRRPCPLIVRTIGPISIVAEGIAGAGEDERQGGQHERQGEERRAARQAQRPEAGEGRQGGEREPRDPEGHERPDRTAG